MDPKFGVIKKLKKSDGYGFLTVEGRSKDLFFHVSGMVAGQDFKSLEEGQEVQFDDVVNTGKGDSAVGVSLRRVY